MEALKIFDDTHDVAWDYDGDADVLYLFVDKPRSALGIDIGEGIVARVDETSGTVVGLTVIGLNSRLQESLREANPDEG